jgi:hypothetical protein
LVAVPHVEFTPTTPLFYPPSIGVSGLFLNLKAAEDGGSTIDFARTANCDQLSCLHTQVSATTLDLPLSATTKLLSGTPAEYNEGCGAHGCDQFVRWKSKEGMTYTVRHLIEDMDQQHPPESAMLALASAAEQMGPGKAH